MTRVVLDEAFEAKIHNLTNPVELCDPSGRILGHFVPVQSHQQTQAAVEECPYSEEELTRMRRETGGRRLKDIWRDVGRK